MVHQNCHSCGTGFQMKQCCLNQFASKSSEPCIAKTFNDSTYSDVKLLLGPSKLELPAHRVILGLKCPYFHDAFKSKMKEDKEGIFHFEDNEHALWRVFQYLYTGKYDDSIDKSIKEDSNVDDPELCRHPRVYQLADYFRLDSLKDHSLEKFEGQLQKLWLSDTFAQSVHEVYSQDLHNDRRLKDAVVEVAVQNIRQMQGNMSFQSLVQDEGEFAKELVVKLGQR